MKFYFGEVPEKFADYDEEYFQGDFYYRLKAKVTPGDFDEGYLEIKDTAGRVWRTTDISSLLDLSESVDTLVRLLSDTNDVPALVFNTKDVNLLFGNVPIDFDLGTMQGLADALNVAVDYFMRKGVI